MRLSELGKVVTGKTPKTAIAHHFDGPYPFVTPTDMSEGRFINHTARSLSEVGLRSVTKSSLPRGAIMVSCIGSDMGKTFIAASECFTNQQINSILVSDEIANNMFVYYNLLARRDELRQLAAGSSAQPILNKSNFSDIEIVLPSRPKQDTIAETLGALDDKIEANRRMNGTLEAMARAVFRDWFVDFGPTRRQLAGASDPHAILGGLIEDASEAHRLAPLFPARLADNGLPEGWEEGTLGDYATDIRDTVLPESVDTDTPYIGLEHMPRRSVALTDWEPAAKVTSNKSRFQQGQILFGKLRPYFHKTGIAPLNGICSTDIVVIDAKRERDRAFIAACVSTDEFVAFTDQTSTGTKMPRTKWGTMKTFELPKAPSALLEAYSEFSAPLLEKIIASIHENRTLASTRDLLLPKLMSGEIQLATIKSAEPATQAQPEPTFATDLFGDEYLSPEQEEERDAVIVAAAVGALRKDNLLVGNVRVMKGSYLIKRKLGLSVGQFERQAAGPYDRALNHEVRSYARDRSWIRETVRHSNGHRIPGNRPARNFSQINPLIEKYGLGDAVKWLNEYFRGATRDWMECVTTVDVAMQELTQRGQPISVEAIKADIASDPEWKPKLSNPHFADAEINRAILHLRKIFAE